MSNFLTPSSIAKADAARRNANGEASRDAIRKAREHPQRATMEALLMKGMKPSRVSDPNADDAVDKDEDDDGDDDMVLTTTERADLRARRKARADAEKRRGGLDACARAVKSIHSRLPQSEDPDHFTKLALPANRQHSVDSRPSVMAIRKAQQSPMSAMQLFTSGNGNHEIDMTEVARIVASGQKALRKSAGIPGDEWRRMNWAQRQEALGMTKATPTFSPTFPRESSNLSLANDPLASTGAGNDWHDEGTQRPAVSHMGGHATINVGTSDARIQAAVTASGTRDATVLAIKTDWARRKMQLASTFANRPAARSNDPSNP